MTSTQADETERQRAILNDPILFAEEMWSSIFMHFDMVLSGELASQSYRDQHEAFEEIIRGTSIPGATVKEMVLWSQDIINNLTFDMQFAGIQAGLVVEQLRQGLLGYLRTLESRERRTEKGNENALTRIRGFLKLENGVTS